MCEVNTITKLNSRGLTCSTAFVERCDLIRAQDGSVVSLTDLYERKINEYMEYMEDLSCCSLMSSSLHIPISKSRSLKKAIVYPFSKASDIFTRSSQSSEKEGQEEQDKNRSQNHHRKIYKESLKKFSVHICQCIAKALGIPAVILLDIIGNIAG